jgi:hypothetical protein
MSMFPGAGAQVYYSEAGEPLGWDYPGEPEYVPDEDTYDGPHGEDPDDDEPPVTLAQLEQAMTSYRLRKIKRWELQALELACEDEIPDEVQARLDHLLA